LVFKHLSARHNMAVQKSKKSVSRRGMRRSHDAVNEPTLSTDAMTGESHRRHQITASGHYRGKKVVNVKETL